MVASNILPCDSPAVSNRNMRSIHLQCEETPEYPKLTENWASHQLPFLSAKSGCPSCQKNRHKHYERSSQEVRAANRSRRFLTN